MPFAGGEEVAVEAVSAGRRADECGKPAKTRRGVRMCAPPSVVYRWVDQQSLMTPVVKLMDLLLCGVPMAARQAPLVMLASPDHV
jgi:hypothetical protein